MKGLPKGKLEKAEMRGLLKGKARGGRDERINIGKGQRRQR